MRLSSSQIEAIKQEAGYCAGNRLPARQLGFTMVELIMVTVIMGILAAVAVPRFFDANVFKERGFSDEIKASLRFAQKTAIAQRKFVCVALVGTKPSSVTLTINSTTDPSGAGALTNCPAATPLTMGSVNSSDTSFTITPATPSFYFNALGKPYQTNTTTSLSTVTIDVNGNTLKVENETGYVH